MHDLFGTEPGLPEGFRYHPEFVAPEEERELVEWFASLPFKPFEFQGYVGNRRVLSFGWQYDFNVRQLQAVEEMPDNLLPLRNRSAAFAGLHPTDIQHVLLTEYAAGAGIGWHRDKGVFGEVVGLSLLSACTLRFRRKQGSGWERASVAAEPRSAYLLKGLSRTEWEHSIPPVPSLRYSITFRNLKTR